MPTIALLDFNPFSKEFWENFAHILESAKDNPLGLALGIIILASLVGLALAIKASEKFKAQVAGGIFVLALIGFLVVGSAQVQNPQPSGGKGSSSNGSHSEPVTLSALVMDAKTRRPVAFARVTLATPGRLSTTNTNSAGVWRVENISVPPDSHPTVYVDADNYVSYQGDISPDPRVEPSPILLDPAPHGRAQTSGVKLITLLGTVFTGNRSPVVNAEVVMESGGTPPQQEMTYTVSNGSFRFVGVRLRPDLKITARAKAYLTASVNLSENAATQPVEIRLDPESAK
jgi:hypothetical protein